MTSAHVAANIESQKDTACLNFHNAGFQRIDPFAFENSAKVREVNLSFNRIREIECGVLRPLKNLRTLQLHGNRILDINTIADECSQRLETLTLHANEIESLPSSLRNFRNLVSHYSASLSVSLIRINLTYILQSSQTLSFALPLRFRKASAWAETACRVRHRCTFRQH